MRFANHDTAGLLDPRNIVRSETCGCSAGIRGVTVRTEDEDAATVIAILVALAASSGSGEPEPEPRSVWADPAYRLGLRSSSANGWWASGLPR